MTTDTSSGRQKTDQVKEEGRQLTDEARSKGQEVGRQAKREIGHVFDEARVRAKDQAEDQTQRAAHALHGMARQLDSMVEGAEESGFMVDMAENGADRIRRFADHVDEAGFEGMMRDIESFARRRPGLYLAAGVGLGVLAGRLLRAADMRGVRQPISQGPDGEGDESSERVGQATPSSPEPIGPATQVPQPGGMGSRPSERPGGTSPGGPL